MLEYTNPYRREENIYRRELTLYAFKAYMKAKLVTYSAKNLTKNEASKLSKALIGYKDKSNKAQYTYKRKGLVTKIKHILISRSTFIVPKEESEKIISFIKQAGGTARCWNINIPKKDLKD